MATDTNFFRQVWLKMTGKSMEKHLSAQEIGDRKALQIDQTGLRMIDPTKQLGFW